MLKELRKKKGLTQAALAEKLNRKQSVVSSWENGNATPDIFIVSALSAALGVSIETVVECFTKKGA
ncbi:MAG: helix-turn-helix transcriptional regulator [Clostridia bacterium]|nr:helix-turn-helix transcriptional regulator [Clostridia bacterium]